MIGYNENFDDNSILLLFIQPHSDPTRGQVPFCHNLIVNLFEKGNRPCKQEFPESRIKRRILDYYLKGICNTTSKYAIITIEVLSPKVNHPTDQKQTDDLEIEFSKIFTDYIRKMQHQNSQRVNSIFKNDDFFNHFSYLSILELKEIQNESPTQTSRHSIVRQEIYLFSKFFNTIRENLISNEISQNVTRDLQRILALFIID